MSTEERMDTSEVEIPNDREIEKVPEREEESSSNPRKSKRVSRNTPNSKKDNSKSNGADEDVSNDNTNDDKKTEAEVEEHFERIEVSADQKTPSRRGKPRKVVVENVADTAVTPGKRGRKRKPSASESTNTTFNSTFNTTTELKTPGRKTQKMTRLLSYKNFAPDVVGDRVLSCGEGEALGHPGRTTTKKPRKVDVIEELDLKPIQAVAGGVHSAILTEDGQVYMCGINEKGTVPAEGVENEGSTDEFTRVPFSEDLQKEGKIVMLAAGASFTAALTDQGSVIAWGNLRNSNGNVDVHPLLHAMQEKPVVIVRHDKRKIVKIVAGENHLVMLDEVGQVLTFGDGEMGQLGRSIRTKTIRSKFMCDESGDHLVVPLRFRSKKFYDVVAKNVFASGFWTIVHGEDGKYYAFGLNNYAQLGIKVDEANTDNVGPDGQDNRELRVFLPTEAPSFGAEETFLNIDGVQHVVVLGESGNVYTMGKNTDNALGLGNWAGKDDQQHWLYDSLQKLTIEGGSKVIGVSAKLATSIVWTDDGKAYAWGFDTTGQLGLGLKDDDEKMVSKPELITSAHLDGFSIIGASISDQHTMILAKKQ